MRGFAAFADRTPIVKGALVAGGRQESAAAGLSPTSFLLLPDCENMEEPGGVARPATHIEG